MKHYLDDLGQLRAIGEATDIDGDQSELVQPTWTLLTPSDVYAILHPPKTQSEIYAELILSAQIALDKTDIIALRCWKAGIAYPAAWQTYTTSLRNIVNGIDKTSTTLPAMPSYPVGT